MHVASTLIPPTPKLRKVNSQSSSQLQLQQISRIHTAVRPAKLCTYLQYVKAIYSRVLVPDSAKWPHIRAKKPVHLACVKKDKVSRGEADEYTRDTIHGNVDDILYRKESMQIHEVACLEEDGSYPDCVLIEGAPGVGKTTLASMLCKGWNNGELLKHYFLVLLLRLRDKSVREASTVMDLFQHPDIAIRQTVEHEVKITSGSGLLLILEGFDELSIQQRTESSLFLDLLQGKHLPLATKLVTSRPSAAGFLREACGILQHIEILGFRKVDIQTYVTSELASCRSLLEDFQRYLTSYPYISSMMYIPLNCAIVVEVYQNYKTAGDIIPKTSTELYQSLIQTLLLKHLYEQEWPKQELKSITDLPQSVYQQFIHVCEVAYIGIQEQEVIFHSLPSGLETLGLMQCVPELYADTGHSFSYNFLHLTVQEFLAAYYIHSRQTQEQFDYFGEHHTSSHFKQVLTFLAGLSKLENISPDSIKSLLLSSESKPTIELDGLHWLFEAQNTELIGSVLKSGTVLFKPSQYPNPFDCYTLGYCIASSSCMWELEFSDCHIGNEEVEMLGLGVMNAVNRKHTSSGHISNLDFRNNTLTSECLKYLELLPSLDKLTGLDFCKNKLNSTACSAIAKCLPLMPNVQNICLSLNPIGCGGAVPLLSQLSFLANLQEIGLYNTRIGFNDIEAICEQLPLMKKLSLLEVGSNQLDSKSIQKIIDSLLSNVPLRKLAMSYTQLSPGHVIQLAQVIKTNPNLEALYLQGCSIGNCEACELAHSLYIPNIALRILNLNENELAEEAGAAFAEALKHNSSLHELWLVKNKIGETATNMLIKSLECNRTLHTLKLPVVYQSAIAAEVNVSDNNPKPRVIWH